MMIPNGTEIIEEERIARLIRMAKTLEHSLMNTDGIGQEMRAEALGRVKRWMAEAGVDMAG